MAEVRLNIGYGWDEETRSISAPVMSLPHGEEVIWYETLDAVESGVAEPLQPEVDWPALPAIELVEDDDEPEGTEER